MVVSRCCRPSGNSPLSASTNLVRWETSQHATPRTSVSWLPRSGWNRGNRAVAWMEHGMTDGANIQAAFDHLASRAQAGDAEATELMTAHGDLWMYWHIRGSTSAPARMPRTSSKSRRSHEGRARLLITAGLASWTLRSNQQALEEWSEAYRIAEDLGDRHTMANATVGLAVGNIGIDLARPSLGLQGHRVGPGARLPLPPIPSPGFDGVHAISGDAENSQGPIRGSAVHPGPTGRLPGRWHFAWRPGPAGRNGRRNRRSPSCTSGPGRCFGRLGIGPKRPVLGEMAWSYLAHGDSGRARHSFLTRLRPTKTSAASRALGSR